MCGDEGSGRDLVQIMLILGISVLGSSPASNIGRHIACAGVKVKVHSDNVECCLLGLQHHPLSSRVGDSCLILIIYEAVVELRGEKQ